MTQTGPRTSIFKMKTIKLKVWALFLVIVCWFTTVVFAEQPFTIPIFDPPAKPVGPSHDEVAQREVPLETFIEFGEHLFLTKFNTLDGAGRPGATGDSKPTVRYEEGPQFSRIAGPDANSCFDCHNQPRIGGGSGVAGNVFVGAHFTNPVTRSVEASITNERGSTTLFGIGIVEIVATEITEDLQKIRAEALKKAYYERQDIVVELTSKGIHFGFLTAFSDGTYSAKDIEGIDPDLVIRPFGVKGVAASIREFSNFALHQHHGIQTTERFGWQRTGSVDFDRDGVVAEFSPSELSALVVYQATLELPTLREDADAERVVSGRTSFERVQCNSCHRLRVPVKSAVFSEPNSFNRSGNALPENFSDRISVEIEPRPNSVFYRDLQGEMFVDLFSDLKRHKICDEELSFFCNEEVPQDFVALDEFVTSRTWDLGTSGPYGHRGHLTTVSEAIYHHGGEARTSRDEFYKLTDDEKADLVYFLLSYGVR